MRALLSALILGAAAVTPVLAETLVPDRRLVVTRDVDFYGADLQALFDTNLQACQKLCLDNPECQAFTFNSRSNACFPKTEISDRQPYEGAISAQVIATEAAVQDLAAQRGADLSVLGTRDLERALAEARAIGPRHSGGQWSVEQLLNAARSTENLRDALNWTGSALAQTDGAEPVQFNASRRFSVLRAAFRSCSTLH